MPKKFLLLAFATSFLVSVPAQAVDSSLTRSFTDIDANDPYFWSFEINKDLGIITGDGNPSAGEQTTVRPEDGGNRAETMAMLLRRLEAERGEEIDTSSYQNCFIDVQDQWFAGPVCYAKQQGWVEGYPDGYFHPEREVIEAEFWKMLLNTAGYENEISQVEALLEGTEYEWYEPFTTTAQLYNLVPGNAAIVPGDSTRRKTMSEGNTRTLVGVLELLSEDVEESTKPAYNPRDLEDYVEEEDLPLAAELVTGTYVQRWEEHVADTVEANYDHQAPSASSIDKSSLDFYDNEYFCGNISQTTESGYTVNYEDGSALRYRMNRGVNLVNVKLESRDGILYVEHAFGNAYLNSREVTFSDYGISSYSEVGHGYFGQNVQDNRDDGMYNFDIGTYISDYPDFELVIRGDDFYFPVRRESSYTYYEDPSQNQFEATTISISADRVLVSSGFPSTDTITYEATGDLLGSGSLKTTAKVLGTNEVETTYTNWSFHSCEESNS